MVWYFFCTVPPPPKLGFAASPLWPPPPLPLDFNMANSPMQPLHCAHQCVFRRSGFHNSLWETTRPFQCRTASRFCSLPTVVQINKHITSQSATGTTAQALLENACARKLQSAVEQTGCCVHTHTRVQAPTRLHAVQLTAMQNPPVTVVLTAVRLPCIYTISSHPWTALVMLHPFTHSLLLNVPVCGDLSHQLCHKYPSLTG